LDSIIDYDFYTLFDTFTYQNHTKNQVFSRAEFFKVFGLFKECIRKGQTVMAHTTTTTVPNDWWGIKAKEIEILWFYNEAVPVWQDSLASEIREQIGACSFGAFPDFPHYKTEFPERFPSIVELSPAMAKLLYELQYYNVHHDSTAFDFIKEN